MNTFEFRPKLSNQFYTPEEINQLFTQIQSLINSKVDLSTGICPVGLYFTNGGGIINLKTEQSGDLEGYNV